MSMGVPGIFNTDEGSQFTSEAFTSVLLNRGVRVSMDNIFIERLWKSVQYEESCLNAYESVVEARAGIGAYLRFYDNERPHQPPGLPDSGPGVRRSTKPDPPC